MKNLLPIIFSFLIFIFAKGSHSNDASECSMCNCDAIELFSDGGLITKAIEYNDTEEYNVAVPNDKDHEFWEALNFDVMKGNYNYESFREKLLAVDLHSPEFGSFWKSFSTVYRRVLDDGTEAYIYKARIGVNWQIGPSVHAKHEREFRWAQRIERATDNVNDAGENIRTVDVSVNIVLKSETWINGYCSGSCPNNCTGNQGGGAEFDYIQKSVNPVKEDLRIPDSSIKFMCRNDYEKYLKTTRPCLTKADHPDGKGESNKSCKFPFVFKKSKTQRQN